MIYFTFSPIALALHGAYQKSVFSDQIIHTFFSGSRLGKMKVIVSVVALMEFTYTHYQSVFLPLSFAAVLHCSVMKQRRILSYRKRLRLSAEIGAVRAGKNLRAADNTFCIEQITIHRY